MPHRRITSSSAKEYSRKVDEGKEFVTASGKKVQSLYELYDVIQSMTDEEFLHHVSESRNDFRNWIYHVVRDMHLAALLTPLKKKVDILVVIEHRIKNYKKHLNGTKTHKLHKQTKLGSISIYEPAESSKKSKKKEFAFPSEYTTVCQQDNERIKGEKTLFFLWGIVVGFFIGVLLFKVFFTG